MKIIHTDLPATHLSHAFTARLISWVNELGEGVVRIPTDPYATSVTSPLVAWLSADQTIQLTYPLMKSKTVELLVAYGKLLIASNLLLCMADN